MLCVSLPTFSLFLHQHILNKSHLSSNFFISLHNRMKLVCKIRCYVVKLEWIVNTTHQILISHPLYCPWIILFSLWFTNMIHSSNIIYKELKVKKTLRPLVETEINKRKDCNNKSISISKVVCNKTHFHLKG